MQTVAYKEYTIIASAFQDDEGRWIGQATIEPESGEAGGVQNPMAFDQETFHTEEEAEDFAVRGAQFFVDNNPDISPQ